MKTKEYKTFEHLDIRSTNTSRPLRIIILYHSDPATTRPFLDELSSYLSEVIISHGSLLTEGDFHLHFDVPDARRVEALKELFVESDLQQHVLKPPHRAGHILDLVITRNFDSIISAIEVRPPVAISNHGSVVFTTNRLVLPPIRWVCRVRDLWRLNKAAFAADLAAELGPVDLRSGVEDNAPAL